MTNSSTNYPHNSQPLKDSIAVFDSGVGGITVLAAARKLLPGENFRYFADIVHAPYGDKDSGQVLSLMKQNIDYLVAQGTKAVVIACNTATSAAAEALRSYLSLPVLGIEPALKPAALAHRHIVVLATKLTLREEKFARLLQNIGGDCQVIPLACPGLMELAEADFASEEAHIYLNNLLYPYRECMEAVVLGCTHYVFFRPWIQQSFPRLAIYDGNQGVSQHLAHVLAEKKLLNPTNQCGKIIWDCSLQQGRQRQEFVAK
ncbi:MAG: glutamate racemase, partial [Clostridiales bacterium]